jgi:hypothetical protein
MCHCCRLTFSGCLRWGVVIAASLSWCAQVVPEDKPPETAPSVAAAQSVARILRSWKEREDRAKTLHCVWDTEKSSLPIPGESKVATRGVAVWQATSNNECWLGRDSQYRLETTTERRGGPTGRETNHQWTACGGRAYSSLSWAQNSTLPRRGRIFDLVRRRAGMGYLDQEMTPLAWSYRPSLRADLKPGQFTLVTEDALLAGLRCAKLRHRQGQNLSSFWFDPRRGDALVFWRWEVSGSIGSTLSLRYQPGKPNDPAPNVCTPSGWTVHNDDGSDDVSQVKTIEINKQLAADAFQIKFTPGTAVAVDLDGSTQEAYVVKPDGTQRTIFNLNTISSAQLRSVLLQRIGFTVDPGRLRDAIDFVRHVHRLAIAMDETNFRKAKIPPSSEVECDTPGIRVWELLTWFSAQCPHPFGIYEQKGQLVLKPL